MSNVEGRLRWLELLKAVNRCLPPYVAPPPEDPKAPIAARISARNELHVTSLDCQQMDDVSTWYAGARRWDSAAGSSDAAAGPPPPAPALAPPTPPPAGRMPGKPPAAVPGPMPGTPAAPSAAAAPPAGDSSAGPKGPGWIVQLTGFHFHNADRTNQGAQYVRNTLIRQLRDGKLELPVAAGGKLDAVTMKDLGISCPVLVNPRMVREVDVTDPNAEPETARSGGMGMPMGPAGPGMGMGGVGGNRSGMPGAPDTAAPGAIRLKQFDFVVQFCWQPKTPSERHEAKKAPDKP